MSQTRVVPAHLAIVPEGVTPQGPMILAGTKGRRAFPFPAAGHQLPFQVTKKEQASVPIGRRATRVQGLSLGVFSPSPRLSALRAQTGAGQFGATAIPSTPCNQEGKRKSELRSEFEL